MSKLFISVASVGLVSVALAAPAMAEKGGVFAKMSGKWKCSTGGCWVKPVDGKKERVACRVNYDVSNGGKTLKQKINCKGGIKLTASSKLYLESGGKVTGDWSSYNSHTGRVKGGATGIARSNKLSLGISGTAGFLGAMRVNVSGKTLTVSLFETRNGKRHQIGKLKLKR